LDRFHKDSNKSDGLYTICKGCRSLKKVVLSEKAIEKRKIDHRLRRKNVTPEQREKNRIWKKEYYYRNRDRIRSYENNRIKNNLSIRISNQVRKRLGSAIKSGRKKGSAVRDLGCSMEFFISYIENLFQPGMSWDNYGKKGWHLDHIIPLASFDLTDEDQFKKAVHYTNIQPLWELDNLIKSYKVSGE
jgi:hypothetical protein